jgi:hypothetical protein
MIDTQQQYINLNIRGEISIIVVQAHYNNLVFIEKMGCIKMRKIRRVLFVLLLCINHNCYLYMPSWGPDLVNKLILFYSIL